MHKKEISLKLNILEAEDCSSIRMVHWSGWTKLTKNYIFGIGLACLISIQIFKKGFIYLPLLNHKSLWNAVQQILLLLECYFNGIFISKLNAINLQ